MERIFLSVAVAGLSGVDTSFLYLSVPDGQFQKACGIYESMGTAGLLFSSLIFTLFLKDNYRGAGFFTVLTYGAAFVLSLFLSRLPGNPSARSEKHRNKPICFRQSLDLLKNFFCQPQTAPLSCRNCSALGNTAKHHGVFQSASIHSLRSLRVCHRNSFPFDFHRRACRSRFICGHPENR